MRFSKRVQYGLVFLLQLHYSWPEHRSVKELAESDDLPSKFLEGIAADFRKFSIVNVKRGAQGGYSLAKPLKEITFLEVLRCLDPEWERQNKNSSRENRTSRKEAVSSFLNQTSGSVDRVFGEIFLDVLPALNVQDEGLMYYI
ncbi:Rrf2 family transcriptional regulator [Marinilabilia salmonicolor]|jgi:Rrf2 family protein|uniref:BadM/Rrf2 family transcriptional regulator n=1 Tax=Marinilabilia salmonicolor TaxID=989 RepID=A0A2T0XER8_9BACT|nr:Rrf2 family transcriptional regulator [Marinilabilia salmonicolor]PRY97415.1 BadM/Rrf2 family transcriptional regulator [Marinilabilia salmonicolor]RCW35356.1 BadM/Rrf2 family transcriptional regulator [Marinilabilia salmonicolor]